MADTAKLDRLLAEMFLDSYQKPPKELILDMDATDDPVHGEQEGRCFHAYYDEYCCLPLNVTCGPYVLSGRLRIEPWRSCSGSWRRSGSAGPRYG